MLQMLSPNRGGGRGPILWVIIHTAEGAATARALGNYFASTSAQASSHVGIDDSEIVQYVPYDEVAWTALEANPYADQAELCGFAAWDRATWLAHDGMLTNTARWVADRCRARSIPPTRISPALVAARKPGVIGHIDVTNAFYGGSGHTDPGPGFPWDVVLARASAFLNGQEDDMTPEQWQYLQVMNSKLDRATMAAEGVWGMLKGSHKDANDRLTDLWTLGQAILAKAGQGGEVDPKALAAAIGDALPKAEAQAVAKELIKLLQSLPA